MAISAQNTEIFCGVARLPREMASTEPSSYLSVELEVDMERQVITDTGFTSFPLLLQKMVSTLVLGTEPAVGVAVARSMIEER